VGEVHAVARPRGSRPPAHDGDAPAGVAVAATAAALSAVVAFHGALRYGFSQDDFLSLARAQGLAPRLGGAWRIVSNQWAWDALVRAGHGDAGVAHAFVLVVHAAAAAGLAVLLARRYGAPAALPAAAIWASHPASMSALYWISAWGDAVSALGVIAVVALARRRDAGRWLAVPVFAAALAWKESVLLLPAALLALAAWGGRASRPWRECLRDPLGWALAATSLAWAAAITPVLHGLAATSEAYAPDAGSLGRNALTYASWLPSFAGWIQGDISDDARPAFVVMGAVVVIALLLALRSRRWRAEGAAGALAAIALLLAPVLPAAHHVYRYYLVAPLLGAAVASAAAFSAFTATRSARARWAFAAAIALPLVMLSAGYVGRVERAPFGTAGLRADRTVDRALIATHAIADLRAAALPAGARVHFWSPISQQLLRDGGGDPRVAEGYEERNVRAALLDGLAIRVAIPALGAVAFEREFHPADSTAWWAVYRPDGHLGVRSTADMNRLLTAMPRP
jgi:hypothetical protein